MNNAAIKYQFEQWVLSLDSSKLNNIQIKFLNLLIDNFDTLVLLGISSGRRAKKISELIEKNHETLLDIFPDLNYQHTSAEKLNRIDELIIGPFRGFSTVETFVFEKKYTFIYGPNGSGKSSFCEGLEYALLGSIEEAETKRIKAAAYIQNKHKNYSEHPVAHGRNAQQQKVRFIANSVSYRFSFVEKNRIDGFARITATTPSNQKDRIATLFGLDTFSDFVDGFTDNFAEISKITLTNKPEEEFTAQSQKIAPSKERITEIDTALIANRKSEKILIDEIGKENVSTIESLKSYLLNEINNLHEKKAENIPNDIQFYVIDLLLLNITWLEYDLKTLTMNLKKWRDVTSEVNYKNLYEAIESIAQDSIVNKSICPACKTSIVNVIVNPYENAVTELAKLREISDLQKNIELLGISLANQTRNTNSKIEDFNTLKITVSYHNCLTQKLTEFDYTNIVTIDRWKSQLENELINIKEEFRDIETLYVDIYYFNTTLQQKHFEKNLIDEELIKHQNFDKKITEITVFDKTLTDEREKLEEKIRIFDENNDFMIKKIAEQNNKIEINKSYVAAYEYLIGNLKLHRKKLPAQLAEGLSDKVMDYYNTINAHDADFEKLRSLVLPTVPEQKIWISFNGDGRPHDALSILSEGHIKVLGLSILLAKAVKEELGFLIFDDIVNAIDDDHRDGIAELLLKHPDLKDKQQIITCHGEMFINKLEHKLGASVASKEIKHYRFVALDSTERRGIQVAGGDSKHYLLKAETALNKHECKDAAFFCRRAVESISEQLWKKLSKKLNINLTVKMKSPTSKPDLATVVDGLIGEVSKISGCEELSIQLKQLKENYNWMLQNKGTHEQGDLSEFDRKDVKNLYHLVTGIEEKVQIINLKIILTPVSQEPSLAELLAGSPKQALRLNEEDQDWLNAHAVGKEI